MKEIVVKVDLHDEKQKKKAMSAVSCLPGISSIDVSVDKQLTVVGDVDPVDVVKELRNYWNAELSTVGPARNEEHRREMERRRKEEQRKEMERRRKEEQRKEMERRRKEEQRKEMERRRKEEQRKEMERRRRNEEQRKEMERRNEERRREMERRRNEEHRREGKKKVEPKEEKNRRTDPIVLQSTTISDFTKIFQAVSVHGVPGTQGNKWELEAVAIKLKGSGNPPQIKRV